MLEEIKKIKSSKKELKEFGITLGVVFAIVGGFLWWQQKDYFIGVFVISGLFLFFGLFLPVLLLPVHKIWMTIAILIGFIVTRVILALLFYFLISPLSMVSRLFGRQFLDLELDTRKNSYWSYRPQKPFNKESYEKQY